MDGHQAEADAIRNAINNPNDASINEACYEALKGNVRKISAWHEMSTKLGPSLPPPLLYLPLHPFRSISISRSSLFTFSNPTTRSSTLSPYGNSLWLAHTGVAINAAATDCAVGADLKDSTSGVPESIAQLVALLFAMDQAKMMESGIQNDFAGYRRVVNKVDDKGAGIDVDDAKASVP